MLFSPLTELLPGVGVGVGVALIHQLIVPGDI